MAILESSLEAYCDRRTDRRTKSLIEARDTALPKKHMNIVIEQIVKTPTQAQCNCWVLRDYDLTPPTNTETQYQQYLSCY